jgi:hypothetical protein
VDELKRMLGELQFTDEYGEGCPSGWKTGDKGVKLLSHDEDEMISPFLSAIPPNSPVRPQFNRSTSWTTRFHKTLSASEIEPPAI